MGNSAMGLKGHFRVEHFDADGNLKATHRFPNGIVDVGLNKILDDMFYSSGADRKNAWYIGLVDNTSWTAFANSDTMASHAGWIEFTNYATSSARKQWDVTSDTAAARSLSNSSTTDFTISSAGTLKGIFITDVSATAPGNTGYLWSTAAFTSTVSVAASDVLKITYTVSG